MSEAILFENIEKLTHAREKLAFIYDCFSQSDNFEFSNMGGSIGVTRILEELVEELKRIEEALGVYMKRYQ